MEKSGGAERRGEELERKMITYLFLSVVLILVSSSCHPRHISDIRLNMTKEEVASLWGRTALVTSRIVNGKTVEIWGYHFAGSDSVCCITFSKDRVAAKQCQPLQAGTNILTVTWTSATIRSGVGNDHPVVKIVKQGDNLTVIGESGDWFNVKLEDGQQGWISNRVVKPTNTGVKPNAYGLGVNADAYGRATTYRLQNGEPLPPIFYDNVRRNAYGPGVHMDQFGRPVRDSRWP